MAGDEFPDGSDRFPWRVQRSLSHVAGGFTLDLQAEGNQISHVAVLEQMYAEEFSRAGLEGWLEEKSIYQISNRAIAAALPSLCEEVSAQDPLQERLRKRQSCFQIPSHLATSVFKAIMSVLRTPTQFAFVQLLQRDLPGAKTIRRPSPDSGQHRLPIV